MNPKRRIHEGIIIGIVSGGIVSTFSGWGEIHPYEIIGGVISLGFAVGYASVIRMRYGKQNLEQTWEENRNSIVKFMLDIFDDDFTSMKPILEKFDFKNENVETILRDIGQIDPNIFKERLNKLPIIQNVLGFITYEQYFTIQNYIKYSSQFIDSLYTQNYQKDILQLRANEAKKIIEFFGYEENNHIGIKEWKKRLSQID